MSAAGAKFSFGEFRLDTGSRQLFSGNGEAHLSPKAFDLLQALVENRVRAMSKAELHERLWPGTFVTETNLASLVAELRRVLDDSAQKPRFIRTVHRFGYAFSGTVDGDASPLTPASSCWIVWRKLEIPLQEGENVVGRDPDVAVRVDAPSVSRRHARILVQPGSVTVEDLGSKNGTSVRGEPISKPTSLNDLDELQVGSVRMVVRVMGLNVTTQTVGL